MVTLLLLILHLRFLFPVICSVCSIVCGYLRLSVFIISLLHPPILTGIVFEARRYNFVFTLIVMHVNKPNCFFRRCVYIDWETLRMNSRAYTEFRLWISLLIHCVIEL